MFCQVLLFLVPCFVQGTIKVLEEDAINSILSDYNKLAYPGTAAERIVQVTHALFIIEIVEFTHSKLVMDVAIKIEWNDTRLTWNGAPSKVRIPGSQIWTPHIVFYNSPVSNRQYFDQKAYIRSNGHVLYVPEARLESNDCKLSNNGTVDCSFKFGSWTYTSRKLDLVVADIPVDLTDFPRDRKYDIVGTEAVRKSKKYRCCPGRFPYIIYTIKIKPRQRK